MKSNLKLKQVQARWIKIRTKAKFARKYGLK